MMIEKTPLMKRVYVMLGLELEQIPSDTRMWLITHVVSCMRMVSNGELHYQDLSRFPDVCKMLHEVKVILYLTDISIEAMLSVLEQLRKDYEVICL